MENTICVFCYYNEYLINFIQIQSVTFSLNLIALFATCVGYQTHEQNFHNRSRLTKQKSRCTFYGHQQILLCRSQTDQSRLYKLFGSCNFYIFHSEDFYVSTCLLCCWSTGQFEFRRKVTRQIKVTFYKYNSALVQAKQAVTPYNTIQLIIRVQLLQSAVWL